jgi:hypothetical protein
MWALGSNEPTTALIFRAGALRRRRKSSLEKARNTE